MNHVRRLALAVVLAATTAGLASGCAAMSVQEPKILFVAKDQTYFWMAQSASVPGVSGTARPYLIFICWRPGPGRHPQCYSANQVVGDGHARWPLDAR